MFYPIDRRMSTLALELRQQRMLKRILLVLLILSWALFGMMGCGSQRITLRWESFPSSLYGNGFVIGYLQPSGILYCGGIIWDGNTNESTQCTGAAWTLPEPRGYAASWQRDSFLYVLGGRSHFATTRDFFRFNAHGEIERLPSMNEPRISFGFVPFPNGDVLVAGGTRGKDSEADVLSTVELYSEVLHRWIPLPPLPTPLEALSGTLVNGKATFFGGISFDSEGHRTYHHEILSFDQGWKEIGCMPVDLSGYGVISLAGHTFLLGGHSLAEGMSSRVFEWENHDIRLLPDPMPLGINDVSAITHGNEIWVIGGEVDDPLHHRRTNLIQHGVLSLDNA